MILVTSQQMDRLKRIRRAFGEAPKLPSKSAWRSASNDDVWIRTISQVVVVGGAAPADRLSSAGVRRRLSWQRIQLMSNRVARKQLWQVLREIKTRYAGRNADQCRKTTAILRNLAFLKSYPRGPKGFLRDVAALNGPANIRIEFVASRLSYIKSKGARDFLTTGFGLLRNSIAFDVRVVGALRHLGVKIPTNALRTPESYAELERDVIDQVCRPLRMTGAELDQLLFTHYKKIKEKQW